MKLGLLFPERIRSLGAFLETEFDQILASISGWSSVQHRHTGAHSHISVDSISSNDVSNITPAVDFAHGQRWLAGPWLMDLIGDASNVAVLRPSQITANQHDYNPPGLPTAVILEVTSDADRNITGIVQNLRQKRLLILGNRGTKIISLIHNSSSSTLGYRFALPTGLDHFIGPNQYAVLYYDSESQLWRSIAQPTPVYMQAALDGNQSISNATYTKVSLTLENSDSHGLFDPTTNYRFTSPNSGLYWASGAILFVPNGGTGYLQAIIRLNGADKRITTMGVNGEEFHTLPVSSLIPMAAGDYLELWCRQNTGASINITSGGSADTYFSVFRYGG